MYNTQTFIDIDIHITAEHVYIVAKSLWVQLERVSRADALQWQSILLKNTKASNSL